MSTSTQSDLARHAHAVQQYITSTQPRYATLLDPASECHPIPCFGNPGFCARRHCRAESIGHRVQGRQVLGRAPNQQRLGRPVLGLLLQDRLSSIAPVVRPVVRWTGLPRPQLRSLLRRPPRPLAASYSLGLQLPKSRP